MSRIRPEELPKPKKVSKKRAGELLATFSVSGTSKYDIYVSAASELNPGESLDVIVLPENVITSIQKKFREQGLTRAKGYFVMSKSLGNEKAGQKSLLIGRYEQIPRSAAKPKKRRTTTTAKAASQAKVTAKRKSVSAKSKSTSRQTRRTSTTKKAAGERKNGVHQTV